MELTIKFEGPVEKTSAFFKNKTKIWMVLEDLTLTHYKDSKKKFCVGSIDLTEVQATRQTGQKQGREFEVTTKSTIYTFTVETDELALAWVRTIQQAMLQRPPIQHHRESQLKPKMFSEYAEVSDVIPSIETNPQKSRIYEELSEIQPTQERNIFGVKLKSSFHRTHSTSSGSSGDYSTVNLEEKPATAPEPVYALPDKSRAKQNAATLPTVQTPYKAQVKGFHRPPPSFAPPPPPKKLHDKDDAKDKSKESCPPLGDSIVGTEKNNNETKAPQTSSNATANTDNDDDHEYYFADSVKRPSAETNDTDHENKNSDKAAKLGYSSFKPCENEYEEIDKQTTTTEPTDTVEKRPHKAPVNTFEDIDQAKPLLTDPTADTPGTRSAGNSTHYEDVDLSIVVRRSRGSHVTVSFTGDTTDTTEGTQPDDTTSNVCETNHNETAASTRRENFRSSSGDKVVSDDDKDNDDVFIDKYKADVSDSKTEQLSTRSTTTSALDAVIASMDNNGTDYSRLENGKAFSCLKQYLESNCDGGFELESHKISSQNAIERLHALLSTKL